MEPTCALLRQLCAPGTGPRRSCTLSPAVLPALLAVQHPSQAPQPRAQHGSHAAAGRTPEFLGCLQNPRRPMEEGFVRGPCSSVRQARTAPECLCVSVAGTLFPTTGTFLADHGRDCWTETVRSHSMLCSPFPVTDPLAQCWALSSLLKMSPRQGEVPQAFLECGPSIRKQT